MNSNKSFTGFQFGNEGLICDYSNNKFPTKLYEFDPIGNFLDYETLKLNPSSSYFVFQYSGYTEVYTDIGICKKIRKEEFACVGGRLFDRLIFYGQVIIIEKLNYDGMFFSGGPIEQTGRLKYIDGCTDSLLIPPVKLGVPCLNALFFPPGINQTQHTHPSMRVGIVLRGKGECITPEGNIPLTPGLIFIIHEEGLHSFRTDNDSEMVVIAYHPDSDFGPTDEAHPMINRTMVGGVSANQIDEIKTK